MTPHIRTWAYLRAGWAYAFAVVTWEEETVPEPVKEEEPDERRS